MSSPRLLTVVVWVCVCLTAAPAQSVRLRPAPEVSFLAPADSNSPAYWSDGLFHLLTSTGTPVHTWGVSPLEPVGVQQISLDDYRHLPMWIESVWQDGEGNLYGWYHHERIGVCGDKKLTEPRIGAVVSRDGGASFTDLGIVLRSGDEPDCDAQNGYFAGGHGDFSVIVDRDKRFVYFLFGNYGGPLRGQGVAMARMALADIASPVGAVYKYHDGAWDEPGLGGRVTPIFPATAPWQSDAPDSFWGPSVHWNTHLNTYVVFLNRSCCTVDWPQEGVYWTANPDLSNPAGWSVPERILSGVKDAVGYYPQVLGLGAGETDSVAGKTARLFVHGSSRWEIVFENAGETEP